VVKCPTCGRKLEIVSKEWDLKNTHVKQYCCCGNKFREYISHNTNSSPEKGKDKKSLFTRIKEI
jgi:hypothetical protein